MPRSLPRPRALLPLLLLFARAASAQAVLGPTEDATVAPVGVLRFRVAWSWMNYTRSVTSPDSSAVAYVQVRTTPISTELGLLPRLSATLIAPGSGTLSSAEWSSFDGVAWRVDSVVQTSHNGLGDVELGAKFAWLAGPSEPERIALSGGVRVRSALSAFYRFATGDPDSPTDPFDVGTGSARAAVRVGSQTDFMIGHGFWLSAVGHYAWPQPVTQPVQVRPPGLPLSAAYPLIDATESGGNYYSIEATPRVVLGRYFSVGMQYVYYHQDASSFVGSKDTTIAGVPVTIDASTLDAASAGTATYLSGSITYSTVAAYLQGKNGLPVEVSFTHTGTLSASGSIPPSGVTNVVTVRFWARLWGSAWKRTKP